MLKLTDGWPMVRLDVQIDFKDFLKIIHIQAVMRLITVCL